MDQPINPIAVERHNDSHLVLALTLPVASLAGAATLTGTRGGWGWRRLRRRALRAVKHGCYSCYSSDSQG
jgi:hypothetical protein